MAALVTYPNYSETWIQESHSYPLYGDLDLRRLVIGEYSKTFSTKKTYKKGKSVEKIAISPVILKFCFFKRNYENGYNSQSLKGCNILNALLKSFRRSTMKSIHFFIREIFRQSWIFLYPGFTVYNLRIPQYIYVRLLFTHLCAWNG